jgi:hypothetical protein
MVLGLANLAAYSCVTHQLLLQLLSLNRQTENVLVLAQERILMLFNVVPASEE